MSGAHVRFGLAAYKAALEQQGFAEIDEIVDIFPNMCNLVDTPENACDHQYRQYFRMVTSVVATWCEKHFTRNSLGNIDDVAIHRCLTACLLLM